MTIGRKGPIGMAPGDEVTVTYDLVAPDPSPQNERVDAPIRSEFSCERFGPVCERDVESARRFVSCTTAVTSRPESRR